MIRIFSLAIALVLLGSVAYGDIGYSAPGSTYTQTFNSLSTTTGTNISWTNDSTIVGWFSNQTVYRASTGTDTTGALYSNGAAGNSDRALGSLASNSTGTVTFGARFTNNTQWTMTQFTVTYDGEQWRTQNNTAQSLAFAYVTGAPNLSLTSPGYTNVTQLNFTSPINNSAGAALDGNLGANRTAGITFTVKNITWLPGQQIMLRWTDVNDSGNDHGLAIDNFNFVAVPEPSTALLGLIAGVGFVGTFRRRRS